MDLVIALFAGAAGGSLISGISPKISIPLWASLGGGMVGGTVFYLIFVKLFMPGGAKLIETPDLASFAGLLAIGFIGGALALSVIFLRRLFALN